MSVPFPAPYGNPGYSSTPMQMPQQPMYTYRPTSPTPTYPMQSPQPVNTPAGPSVRLIANESEINVSDIAMDGQVHLFMMHDYSRIIGKMWTAQGEIATTIFVPMQPEPAKETAPIQTVDKDWMEARFEKLENMILESSTNPEQ